MLHQKSKRFISTILVTCLLLLINVNRYSDKKESPATTTGSTQIESHGGISINRRGSQWRTPYYSRLGVGSIDGFNQEDQDEKEKNRNKRRNIDSRKRLFIIAQGRTGSSLFGDLIDSHDDFIYFFEPLRAVERHFNISYFHLNSTHPLYSKYHQTVTRFVDNLLNCRLSTDDDTILRLHDKGQFRHRSRILTKDPFCTKRRREDGSGISCKPLTSQMMNQYCLDNPNANIVIKELEFRIPEASILRLVKTHQHRLRNVKVIHLVRDPRSFLLSMKRLGWMETPGSDPEHLFIKKRCLEIQNNIITMSLMYHQQQKHYTTSIHQQTPTTKKASLSARYRIFKYEDLALENAERSLGRALSTFLELDFVNTTQSFYETKFTRKSTISHSDPFSTGRRNIKASLQGWRKTEHKEYVKKIEMICKDLMLLLDYEPAYHEIL